VTPRFVPSFALSSLLVANAALADGPRLAYRAPEGCPSEADFRAAVDARRAGAEDDVDARAFEVHVERTPAGRYRGTLVVTDGAERSAEEADCGAVVHVLSVFTALAIDARREREEAPRAAPPPAAPLTAHMPPPASDRAPPVSDDAPAPGRAEPRLRVGLSAGVRTGFFPGGMGATLAADIGRDRPHGWAPLLRFGFVSRTGFERASDAQALFPSSDIGFTTSTRAAWIDLCPLRTDEVGLYLQSCLRVEGGAFEAWYGTPGDIKNLDTTGPHAAMGVTAGLRGNLGGAFFADLEGGALAALTRARLAPGVVPPYTTPGLDAWMGLSVGVYVAQIKLAGSGH
jgi:hypothetical protein